VLDALEIEHPDPTTFAPILAPLAVDVTVKAASGTQLVAQIRGPNGRNELR